MNKVITATLAACLAIAASGLTSSSFASSNGKVATGTCYNAAAWRLEATRNGSKVRATFTASPMIPRSVWNMNTAWAPLNIVGNASVKADSKGRITYKTSGTTAAPVTIYVWADQSDVFTCIASVTI